LYVVSKATSVELSRIKASSAACWALPAGKFGMAAIRALICVMFVCDSVRAGWTKDTVVAEGTLLSSNPSIII
jgi:hypothetical protein